VALLSLSLHNDEDGALCYSSKTNRHEKTAAEPLLDIVLPVFNEAKTIRGIILSYYNEIVLKFPSRLIVAEDGSDDGTKEILYSIEKVVSISLFSEKKRKGFAKGVNDALRKCSAEWVFFSDSDGQYCPADFWKLWKNREGYDIVIGHKVERNDNIKRIILSRGFHIIANNLFNLKFYDADCGFRLIRKDVIDSIIDEMGCLPYSYNAEFAIRSCLKGFKVLEVPISHTHRSKGETKIYKTSKLPLIVMKQLKGLVELFAETKKKNSYNNSSEIRRIELR
jgi:dolichol-phosphate mannosyltransferase